MTKEKYFLIVAYCVEVFGHKCIIGYFQYGEMWSNEEYWRSVLYDLNIIAKIIS